MNNQQDNDHLKLLATFYARNVINRLRELDSSSDNELSRWIWELIQNAKDCSDYRICFLPDKSNQNHEPKLVDIRIIYTNDNIVIFKHNGFPFTKYTLDSLMYKYSTKNGENEGTGRFGTGFMTSHTLSRIVEIKAPYLDYNGTRIITATVFREGRSINQLEEEFYKMENSKSLINYDNNNEEHKWTSFKYKINNETGEKSLHLGIKSFRNNIIKTLLFCPEIRSIQLNDEEPYEYQLISSLKYVNNIFPNPIDITKKIFTNKIETHQYIVFTVVELNDEYSKKYAKDNELEISKAKPRNISYSIAFEINSDNKLIYDQNSKIRLFCTFPLIGSEDFQLPFFLNSAYFEVLTERNGIISDGNAYNNGILTNRGLNEIILSRSIDLFKIALKYMIDNHFTNFCILAKDISDSFTFSIKLNCKFTKISDCIKNILEESEIVKDSNNKNQKLKAVFFLNFKGVKNPKEFHSLASQFYLNIASYEDCENWTDQAWEKLHILSLENFIENISCIGSDKNFRFSNDILNRSKLFNNLNSLTKEEFSFLNRFYSFLLSEESINVNNYESRIWKYPIVLNSKCQLSLISNLKCPKNLSNDLNSIMTMCKTWGHNLINSQIDCFSSIIQKVTFNDAQNELNSFLSNNKNDDDLLLSLIKFIPNNNNKQLTIYNLSKKFFSKKESIPSKVDVKDIDESLWEKVDYYLLKRIQNIIANNYNDSIDRNELSDYNTFYDIYQKICYDSDFMVPNLNLVLKKKEELSFIDSSISQIVLDKLSDLIPFQSYAHSSITSVNFDSKLDLDGLISMINKSIKINDNILCSVLSIFPPIDNRKQYNIQDKISKIATFFLNLPINPKSTNIVGEKFWEKANETIIDKIKNKLKTSQNINKLESSLTKEKDKTFEYLNIYYSISIYLDNSNWKKNTLIPNYYGIFCPAINLSIIKNVPEHYFELYNLIKKDSDVKETFAHSNVQCEYLEVIDLNKFIQMICQNISDRQLINDSKIHERIFHFHPFDSLKSSKNNLLLEKLYLANINDKLNDIKNPTENDKKRWSWELMQYALESCNNNKIDITFDIKSKANNDQYTELTFSHNGRGFNENSLLELIFAVDHKENHMNAKRYGKGFISTHVLSKKVEISGNVISKGKVTGFSFIITREGTDEYGIIKEFKNIQNTCKSGKEPFNLTSFKYEIKTQENQESIKLGLEHLEKHIYQVLINCPQIRSVNIKKNGNTKVYSIQEQKPITISSFQYYQYPITQNGQNYQCISLKDEKNKINISIVLNGNNEIVQKNNDIVSIFSIFPFTGSQKHILPFFLNSLEFVPSTKYDSLILNGFYCISINKNRSILMKSIPLYKELIKQLNDKKCPNIQEMSTGLLLSESVYNSFDLDWYKSNYLVQMRDIFANNVTIKTFSGSDVLIKDAFFPDEKIENNKLQEYIILVDKCFHNNIISVENAKQWKGKIWETANFINVNDLIKEVKNNQELLNDDNLSFFNELLDFIWKYDHSLLYNNELIPDMNNKLHCYPNRTNNASEDFRECKNISNDIIQIMEFIKIPWKSTHMNNAIHSIRLSEDNKIDAQSRIFEKIQKENDLSFKLMKFVIVNDKFRMEMFEIVNKFYSIEGIPTYDSVIEISSIDSTIWNFADSYVLREIAKILSKYDSEKVRNNFSFFMTFVPFFMKYFKKDDEIILSTNIIPNKLYQLNSLKKLSNRLINPIDSFDIHEYLNTNILKKHLNIDFDEKIIHPQINDVVKSNENEKISDFIYEINRALDVNRSPKIDENSRIEIAKLIISLIPENKGHYESLSKQEHIFEFFNKFFNNELHGIIIDNHLFFEYNWKYSNKTIITFICNKIQEYKNMTSFQESFQKEEICYDILNTLYELIEKDCDYKNYKIIPNLKGEFMKKEDLIQNPEIDDDVIKCIDYLDPNFLIQDKIVDRKIKINGLKKFDIFDFYKKLNKLFSDALEKDDEKAYEMIKQINGVDDSSFLDKIMKHNLTKDERFRMDIFVDAHINFLKNYLREVDFKSIKEMMKWPFELIQNANDTVQNVNRKVNITFELSNNKLIFTHDGEPFQNRSLLALLYQSSYGKESKKTTGKFGTGFLSTMIVSRRIQISGDLIIQSDNDQDNDIRGFEVTLFREGTTSDELKNGIVKMEKTIKKDFPKKGITKFEYYLNPNDNKKDDQPNAIDLGFQSLKDNISSILVLNHSIESITIKKNNETIVYKLVDKSNVKTLNNGTFSVQTVSINNEKNERFFVINSKQKFKDSINVPIDILVRVGDVNNIINIFIENNKKSEKEENYNTNFFASYPMFGSKSAKSPFVINSKSFELDKERQFLLIHSKKSNDNNDNSQENNINQFIIEKAVELYKEIIKKIIEMNCKDLFNLFTCLKEDIKDNDFIQKQFILQIREIIKLFPVFETSSGYKMIDEVYIPYDDKYEDFDIDTENEEEKTKIDKDLYDLTSNFNKLNSRVFVTYENGKNWKDLLWKDFPSFFRPKELYKSLDIINNLGGDDSNSDSSDSSNSISGCNTIDSKINYIIKVFNFVKKQKNYEGILMNNNILINESGILTKLSELYRFNLPDILMQMLDTVNYDYKAHMLHHKLNFLHDKINFHEFSNDNAFGQIQNSFNESNACEFMKYVIKSDQNRNLMYEYTKLLLLPKLEKVEIDLQNGSLNKIPSYMYTTADRLVAKKLSVKVNEMSDLSKIDASSFIKLLKDYLSTHEFDKFDKEKFFHKKCLDSVKNNLQRCGKYSNIVLRSDENISFNPNNKKYNFEAVGKSGSQKYYFIVKQAEYFSFRNNYSKIATNSNEHYILSIVFDIQNKNPNIMNFELLNDI